MFRSMVSLRKRLFTATKVRLLLLSVPLWIGSGCHYMRRVDLRSYPESKRTLYLYNFSNEAFQPDINIELTQAMRDEVDRRDNFILTKDRMKARFGLYGAVTIYRKEGRLYDNYRNPTRYELIVAARVRMVDRERSEEGEGGTSGTLFVREVSATADYALQEGYPETELEARTRLVHLLASRIHNVMEEEFVDYEGPAPLPEKKENNP